MKRNERQHLKANPVAEIVARIQKGLWAGRQAALIGGIILLVTLVALGGFLGWQKWQVRGVSEVLAEAMSIGQAPIIVPPPQESSGDDATTTDEVGQVDEEQAGTKVVTEVAPFAQPLGSYPSEAARLEAVVPRLLAVADAYPSFESGITARYQAATGLAALGRMIDAKVHYQSVMTLAGDQIYGRMARLGLAEAHIVTGDYDAAIVLLKGETNTADSMVPIDAVLMRLGRAHRLAGQNKEAIETFTRLVQEFPGSQYYPDAQEQAASLRIIDTVSGD
jgi:predicted negative regulator of RcsB-dependent stress response